jgi:uncharacterized phage protein gp47/JayE
MAFTARDAATIRATILANRAARYRTLGLELSVVPGSDAYIEADAYAIEQELLEQEALRLTKEYFPDTCGNEMLLRHAKLIGLVQKSATASLEQVTITGAPSTTSACSGKTLNAADGLTYVAVDGGTGVPLTNITLDGAGNAAVYFLSQSTGLATAKAVGTILTWSSAPTGFNATGTVFEITRSGADEESFDALRDRVLRWWLERPGAGNRADVVDWCESIPSIYRAYVYPLTHTSLGVGTLGAWRVIVLGAPEARTATAYHGLTAGNLDDVRNYVIGTTSAEGKITANVDPDDFNIDIPAALSVDIQMQIVLGPGYSWPFTGTYTVDNVTPSTTTRVYLTTDPTTVGAGQINVGDLIAVYDPGVRGHYVTRTVKPAGTNAPGVAPYFVEFTTPLTGLPPIGSTVFPGISNWDALRVAILAVCDRLGPGDVDTGTYPDSARWPPYAVVGPATLYRAALVAACMGVPGLPAAPAGVTGVASATALLPATDQTPAAFQLVAPSAIYFTQ